MKTFKATSIAAHVALALTAACGALSAHAATDYSKATPAINAQIQVLLNQAASAHKVPGVSVAVSRHGESIYAGAAGWADIGGNVPLTSAMRTRIGSVSKAIVTGPGGYRMLEAAGREPKQTRIYGADGLLGVEYDDDIAEGANTQAPIVEVDISSNNKTYTWYQNGTVSVGATNNLAQYESPKPFTPPVSWRVIDIFGIAISKNDTVYTWVHDARKDSSGSPNVYVYKGTSTDLDAHMNTGGVNSLGTTLGPKVKLPEGYSALNIVGVAIAKSNDHVYVWYNDGTVSEGISTNFVYYSQPVLFTAPNQTGSKVRNIRGVGIASNNHVYAWYANGTASSGWSRDLDIYLAPYNVQIPYQADMPDFRARYDMITAQHLLDHKAGFTRSGDDLGAAEMFGESLESVSYQQIHRHFLRTRPMLGEPGKVTSYSNHGLGMWTLLVEAQSGIRFADYMESYFIAPMGLSGKIVPQGPTLDSEDALGYTYNSNNNQYSPIEVEESRTGLAAGGYRASTQSLVKAMEWLSTNYSYKCINEMGWDSGGGVLSHNGAIGGGNALVTITPTGFRNSGNRDVGGFRIAIATNRDLGVENIQWMYDLRDDIADLLSSYGPKTAPTTGPAVSNGGFQLACQTS